MSNGVVGTEQLEVHLNKPGNTYISLTHSSTEHAHTHTHTSDPRTHTAHAYTHKQHPPSYVSAIYDTYANIVFNPSLHTFTMYSMYVCHTQYNRTIQQQVT